MLCCIQSSNNHSSGKLVFFCTVFCTQESGFRLKRRPPVTRGGKCSVKIKVKLLSFTKQQSACDALEGIAADVVGKGFKLEGSFRCIYVAPGAYSPLESRVSFARLLVCLRQCLCYV